jgi:DNA polymerase III delta subunit
MKAREIVKKIKRATLQGADSNDFNFENWDASETGIETILDSAQSGSMMGGTKLIVVRNAEEFRALDPLARFLELMEPSLAGKRVGKPDDFQTVLVFVSKGLDGRKKAAKVITELSALIPCEEVKEAEREAWIDFLAKRREFKLTDSERLALRGLEPWNLEIIDQEISKLELVGSDEALRADALRSGVSAFAQDDFIDAIFVRDQKRALSLVHLFSEDVETQLPFLGLLAWNLRQLKQFILEQEARAPSLERRNPMLLSKLERWRKFWNRHSIQSLEHALFEIDFSLKNTRLMGLGLWTGMIFGTHSPKRDA